MKKFMIVMLSIAALGNVALAADTSDAAKAARIMELESQRDILRADLVQIESEQARCERQRRNWRTATVVGGVGVAATATGAVIQHGRNRDQREELAEQQRILEVEQKKLNPQ